MGRDDVAARQQALSSASKERAASWTEANASAIAERRVWIERHGVPLAEIQVLTLPE